MGTAVITLNFVYGYVFPFLVTEWILFATQTPIDYAYLIYVWTFWLHKCSLSSFHLPNKISNFLRNIYINHHMCVSFLSVIS